MFATAYSEAVKFTRPILSLTRFANGNVATGIGTCVVLNADGWILTAAHILQPIIQAQRDAAARRTFELEKARIDADDSIPHGAKRKLLRNLVADPKWITNVSYLFSSATIQMTGNVIADIDADIAIVKLSTLETMNVTAYPKFPKAGSSITPGTSLCTLGFPFQQISAGFDAQTNTFKLNTAPNLAFFPTVGIHTRDAKALGANGRQLDFIETSSPGLKGQSGGPIFDVYGTVWALQSRTIPFPLDIAPVVKDGGKEFKEHQFIQVGLGARASHITQFLQEHQVAFDVCS